jgi:hypothetical protein
MNARKIQRRAASAPMFSLSSIGAAVAMALIASRRRTGRTRRSSASAPGFGGSATGGMTAAVPQNNAGAVNAQVTNATVGTVSTGSRNPAPGDPGHQRQPDRRERHGQHRLEQARRTGPVIGWDAALGVSVNTGTITSKVQNSKMLVAVEHPARPAA